MSQREFSFSIFFTLLGVGVGLGLVFTGLLTSPASLQALYQPRALGLWGGGLLAVLFLSFSGAEIRQSLGLTWEVLSGGQPDQESLMKECIMLATRSREAEGQEQKLYREIKPYLSHRMLQHGVDLLIAGYSPEMIRSTLETRRKQESQGYGVTLSFYQTLARAAWMLGLAAAAVSLVRSHLLVPSLLPFYFAGVGLPIALGLLLAILVFYPLLRKVRNIQQAWQNYLDMSITGVLLLQERHHALYLETVLQAYLPLRPSRPAAPAQASSPNTAVSNTRSEKPRQTGFLQALKQEQQQPEAPAEPIDPNHAQNPLSVRELGKFRPVQPKDKKQP